MTSINLENILNRLTGPKGLPYPGNISGPGNGAIADAGKIYRKVYGPRGLPFPADTTGFMPSVIAGGFAEQELPTKPQRSNRGIKLWSLNNLGALVFMPVFINDIEMPNALISVTGEKAIVETDIVRMGTVFETVYRRPYDITIVATIFSDNDQWPENDFRDLLITWDNDQLVTLDCALTENLLQHKDNFIITKITLPEMQGVENCQVVQFDGRSSIDFELELI